MKNSKLIFWALVDSLGIVLYVSLVVQIMSHAEQILSDKDFVGPIMFLLLFVVSACITGGLFLGRPILMYIDGLKKEAVKLFFYTLTILVVLILATFLIRATTASKFVYTNATKDSIQVNFPAPSAVVGKDFSVSGQARGNWFFEASFPVLLIYKENQVLASGIAKAEGDWMTTGFVPFKANLKITDENYRGPATLIFKKDNPSGDPTKDASVSIRVNVE